jgi:hypothetical protein
MQAVKLMENSKQLTPSTSTKGSSHPSPHLQRSVFLVHCPEQHKLFLSLFGHVIGKSPLVLMQVGDIVGVFVGILVVGALVGILVVGDPVVGLSVGLDVVGTRVGLSVGLVVGWDVVGATVGLAVVGLDVGLQVGGWAGLSVVRLATGTVGK